MCFFLLSDSLDIKVYYNQASILDQNSFAVVSQLPNVPANVNSYDGGRTYPFSGAAMILPISAPYTAPMNVIVCGGATQEAVGLPTCVSITPEVPGAQWVIEQMVSLLNADLFESLMSLPKR
jgi:hypothetical protein